MKPQPQSTQPYSRLPDFHQFGKRKPNRQDLVPHEAAVTDRLKRKQVVQEADGGLSYTGVAHYLFDPDAPATVDRFQYLVRNGIDLNDDGRISRQELAIFDYRLDQAGNADGTVSQEEFYSGVAHWYKQYLLEAARQLKFPRKMLEKLESNLAENRFSASTDNSQDLYDLMKTGNHLDGFVEYRKIRTAAYQWESLQERKLPIRTLQTLQRQVMRHFIKARNMPMLGRIRLSALNQPQGLQALEHRVTHMLETLHPINIVKGGFQRITKRTVEVTPCQIEFPFNRSVPVDPSVSFQYERSTHWHFKPPETYPPLPAETAPALVPVRDALIAGLSQPAFLAYLDFLSHSLVDAIETDSPTDLRVKLGPILATAIVALPDTEKTSLYRERLCFNVTGDREDVLGAGCYESEPQPAIVLNQGYYQEKLAAMRESDYENRTPEAIRDWLVRDIVETLVHELVHYVQDRLDKRLSRLTEADLQKFGISRERIQHYRINHEVYNNAIQLRNLFGNKDWYQKQPLEAEAWELAPVISQAVMAEMVQWRAKQSQ